MRTWSWKKAEKMENPRGTRDGWVHLMSWIEFLMAHNGNQLLPPFSGWDENSDFHFSICISSLGADDRLTSLYPCLPWQNRGLSSRMSGRLHRLVCLRCDQSDIKHFRHEPEKCHCEIKFVWIKHQPQGKKERRHVEVPQPSVQWEIRRRSRGGNRPGACVIHNYARVRCLFLCPWWPWWPAPPSSTVEGLWTHLNFLLEDHLLISCQINVCQKF